MLDLFIDGSGGIADEEEATEVNQTEIPDKKVERDTALDDRESKIKAARERFLLRKGKK